ncbi:hypothetical protein V6N11_069942 [Hibiscus sabdariffa]|uniref:Uncharacterized protein n=1 Tax=Hibiscus sabdariffa TaxID=183260 RepID=A0ABR2QDK8_9ROSI
MIDSSLASCEVYNPSAIILSSRSKEEDDEFGPLVATTSANFTAGQDVGIMTALLIGLVDRKSGGLGQSSSIWSSNCAKVVTEPSRSLEHMFKKLVKAQLQVRVLKEGGKDDIEVISTANLRVTVAKNEVEVTCTEVQRERNIVVENYKEDQKAMVELDAFHINISRLQASKEKIKNITLQSNQIKMNLKTLSSDISAS